MLPRSSTTGWLSIAYNGVPKRSRVPMPGSHVMTPARVAETVRWPAGSRVPDTTVSSWTLPRTTAAVENAGNRGVAGRDPPSLEAHTAAAPAIAINAVPAARGTRHRRRRPVDESSLRAASLEAARSSSTSGNALSDFGVTASPA